MPSLNPPRPLSTCRPRTCAALLLLALAGCEDTSRRAGVDEAAEAVDCAHTSNTAPIDAAGGRLCAAGHTLYLPPGALSGPTVVTLYAEPPIALAAPADLGWLAGAHIVFDPPRSLRRPALWTAPIAPPGQSRPAAGEDIAALIADDADRSLYRRARQGDRHIPAFIDAGGTHASTLIIESGRHAMAQPLADRFDRLPAGDATCPDTDGAMPSPAAAGSTPLCHALDAHRPPPPVDADEALRLIGALYRSPLVTERLAALLQSDARARGEFADLLPVDAIALNEISNHLRQALDVRLCITEPIAGEAIELDRAAAMLDDFAARWPRGTLARRDAALALAGRALLAVTTDALAVEHDTRGTERLGLCDPESFADLASSRAAARLDADAEARENLGDAPAPLDVPTLTHAGVRWDLPPAYARAIAAIAGDLNLAGHLAETPRDRSTDDATHDRCRFTTLVAPGTPTPTADDLSLLAEHAWLTAMLAELDAEQALPPDSPPFDRPILATVLDRAMHGDSPLAVALLRLLEAEGKPLARGELAWTRRRATIDAEFALPLLTPTPHCVEPPSPPADRDEPDPCAPRLREPESGSVIELHQVVALHYAWDPPPPECLGGRGARYELACGPTVATLATHRNGIAQPSLPLSSGSCDDPGIWWWQVSWIDPTGAKRRSEVSHYRIEPLPADPCASLGPGDDCVAPPGDAAPIDCRPGNRRPPAPEAHPCAECHGRRCVPPGELDGDALHAPFDGINGGEAGERIELPCAGGAVHAPITGRVEFAGRAVCIVGPAFQICLDGIIPDPDRPLAGCHVTAGAALGACTDAGIVIEGYGLDGSRRPLPPPADWRPRPAINGADDGICCPSPPERCNRLDDDCDAHIDEALAPEACARRCEAGGPELPGQTACDAGIPVCLLDAACPPPNDRCDRGERWEPRRNGNNVVLAPRRGDTAAATSDHANAPGCGALDAGDVWYDLHVDRPAILTLRVDGDGWPARITLRRARGACVADPAFEITCGASVDRVEVEPGDYQVVIDGAAEGGPFELDGVWQDVAGACVPGLPTPDADGRVACLEGATVDDDTARAGRWFCDSDGRGRGCVGEMPPPPPPPPLDHDIDPIGPEPEPDDRVVNPPPLVCDPGYREVQGRCCQCRVERRIEDNELYEEPQAPRCRWDDETHVVMGFNDDGRPFDCGSFPIRLTKIEGRPVFDPSEELDGDCTRDPEPGDICHADRPGGIIDLRAIDFTLKLSRAPDPWGTPLMTYTNSQTGERELFLGRHDLSSEFQQNQDDPVYLHVVRDACPPLGAATVCQVGDPPPPADQCAIPRPPNWFWSQILEIRLDCAP